MNRILTAAALAACLYSCGSASKLSMADRNAPDLVGDAASYSVDRIDVKDTESTGYSTIFDYLRAKVPGVQIGYASPGSTPSILIRGAGSFNSSTQPLFIVDGGETSNIANISPYDIASVEVLKDASTSLYGVRGANGVIIIKTKSARDAALKAAAEKKAAKQAARAAKKGK